MSLSTMSFYWKNVTKKWDFLNFLIHNSSSKYIIQVLIKVFTCVCCFWWYIFSFDCYELFLIWVRLSRKYVTIKDSNVRCYFYQKHIRITCIEDNYWSLLYLLNCSICLSEYNQYWFPNLWVNIRVCGIAL